VKAAKQAREMQVAKEMIAAYVTAKAKAKAKATARAKARAMIAAQTNPLPVVISQHDFAVLFYYPMLMPPMPIPGPYVPPVSSFAFCTTPNPNPTPVLCSVGFQEKSRRILFAHFGTIYVD